MERQGFATAMYTALCMKAEDGKIERQGFATAMYNI